MDSLESFFRDVDLAASLGWWAAFRELDLLNGGGEAATEAAQRAERERHLTALGLLAWMSEVRAIVLGEPIAQSQNDDAARRWCELAREFARQVLSYHDNPEVGLKTVRACVELASLVATITDGSYQEPLTRHEARDVKRIADAAYRLRCRLDALSPKQKLAFDRAHRTTVPDFVLQSLARQEVVTPRLRDALEVVRDELEIQRRARRGRRSVSQLTLRTLPTLSWLQRVEDGTDPISRGFVDESGSEPARQLAVEEVRGTLKEMLSDRLRHIDRPQGGAFGIAWEGLSTLWGAGLVAETQDAVKPAEKVEEARRLEEFRGIDPDFDVMHVRWLAGASLREFWTGAHGSRNLLTVGVDALVCHTANRVPNVSERDALVSLLGRWVGYFMPANPVDQAKRAIRTRGGKQRKENRALKDFVQALLAAHDEKLGGAGQE